MEKPLHGRSSVELFLHNVSQKTTAQMSTKPISRSWSSSLLDCTTGHLLSIERSSKGFSSFTILQQNQNFKGTRHLRVQKPRKDGTKEVTKKQQILKRKDTSLPFHKHKQQIDKQPVPITIDAGSPEPPREAMDLMQIRASLMNVKKRKLDSSFETLRTLLPSTCVHTQQCAMQGESTGIVKCNSVDLFPPMNCDLFTAGTEESEIVEDLGFVNIIIPPPEAFADEVDSSMVQFENSVLSNEEQQSVTVQTVPPISETISNVVSSVYGDFLVNPVSGHTFLSAPDIQCEKISFRPQEDQFLPLPRGKSPFLKKPEELCLSPLTSKSQEKLSFLIGEYTASVPEVGDPKAFLTVPLQDTKIDPKLSECIRINRESLKRSEVIGQIDFKFIAGYDPSSHVLFAVDQHAAHERIKLEELMQEHISLDGSVQFSSLADTISLPFSKDELARLKSKEESLSKVGVCTKIGEHCCDVNGLPSCILLRNKFQTKEQLSQAALAILKEVMDYNCENPPPPSSILSALASMACHGSVRFGCKMSRESCLQLVRLLGRQNLPFQCAHGRPSLVPLVKLPESVKKGPVLSLKRLSEKMRKSKIPVQK